MPGARHEVPLLLFQERPELLAELLALAGVTPPTKLTVVNTAVRFADIAGINPDLVLRSEEIPWLVLELQHAVDQDKRRIWPLVVAKDAEGLLRLYERRLGRDLTEPEHTTVVPGSEVDVAYDWLFVNTARTLFGVGVRAGAASGEDLGVINFTAYLLEEGDTQPPRRLASGRDSQPPGNLQ